MPWSQSVIQAMGLASVLDPQSPDDYFLFVANYNDFLTQDGFQVGAAYRRTRRRRRHDVPGLPGHPSLKK
ncbi:hypothetical protein NMA58_16890 [Rhizobium sp. YTUHZ045]